MSTCASTSPDAALVEGLAKIIEPYRGKPSGLIQVLAKAQQLIGYLPKWAQVMVADELGVSLQDVYGVATFYAFFSIIPRGRHKVSVCTGTACHVKGAGKLLKALRQELGVKPGQTTPDSRFTLDQVRCIGACGLAPAIMVDGKDTHPKMEPEQIPALLAQYE